jgi:hypothetical protein
MAYRATAYRDHQRVSDIERETTRMLMGFQRDGPSAGQPPPSARLHAASQQSQHGKCNVHRVPHINISVCNLKCILLSIAA